ncbi:MAG: glycoside-pentoside-hexuronide (GPH):cation symporter [Clostridiales bacterium]|nr:glycoside-pentoside-hexuronide (GPH):cation symporter [Clostridiales bacterium]MCD7828197.1 glycoside-pentoside-hexuronide (GPH):cation symporter [Clostridiales bacterium]
MAEKKGKAKKFLGYCGYGVGAVGLDLSYGMFYSYLNKYLTDVLKLSSSFLLILTPIARIWDGINDPMMGSIVDNGKFKMGKYRPWILIGSFANAVILVLLFNNFFGLSGVGLYIYIAFMYVFWGMSNTLADIPFWSMVPSFTTDPNERSIIATIARTFSGLGQGIVQIGAPILMALVSTSVDTNTGERVYDSRTFMILSVICAAGLIIFSSISVSSVKERHRTPSGEKFSFKKIFAVMKNNDQLIVFMLFAMLSNAGFYMISGVGAYYFDVVVGDSSKQSLFNTFGSVGSILGLAVIPIMMRFTSRRRTYQFSLSLAIAGYIGMLCSAQFAGSITGMSVFYMIAQIGTASMFVSQTVFLADIVDYGEYKMGYRAESVTFSMKGFLQKMAYTLQTIILYAGLSISNYDGDLHSANSQAAHTSISVMMLVLPMIFMALSLIIFSSKFKLHGKQMEEITAAMTEKRKAEEEEGSSASDL